MRKNRNQTLKYFHPHYLAEKRTKAKQNRRELFKFIVLLYLSVHRLEKILNLVLNILKKEIMLKKSGKVKLKKGELHKISLNANEDGDVLIIRCKICREYYVDNEGREE